MYNDKCFMYHNNNCIRAAWARPFMALFAVLAMGLASVGSRAEAAPFAYVANAQSATVSVIDTATNTVVATVPVGIGVLSVAVTPDGKHVYVADGLNTVSVIDTATNTVVATVTVGTPFGVAVTPDGKHVYVAGSNISVIDTITNTVVATVGVLSGAVAVTQDGKEVYVAGSNVSVIDTMTNTVVATIPVGAGSAGIAVTPDGTHVYLANSFGDPITVSVIDTATKKVVATIPLVPGGGSFGIAVTPDGKHVYVPNFEALDVSVIDTATNTVVATVATPNGEPNGIAVTPDGKHVYVPLYASGGVAVIDTSTNTVVAGVPVGNSPFAVGIIPDVPFLAFNAALAIRFGGVPNQDAFALQTGFISSSTAPVVDPLTEPVTLQIGTFAGTIPPGSFKKTTQGYFIFVGVIDGAELEVLIEHTGTLQYALQAKAVRASLTGTTNPVTVRLGIGAGSATTSATAHISP